MINSFETNFISQTTEKTPFADTPAQNFFAEWCKINDSIVPEFISREKWQQRGVQGILEKNDQGKQTLFLPKDLHLWEMMDVIKTVDHDTLARNPEKRSERANRMQELGVIFEKAGLYLSEYLPTLDKDKGRSIAQDIASDFYQYGLSLQHKERKTADIPKESSLSEEDKVKLDEWFLGRDTHQKRLARLGENPSEDQVKATRKKLLSVYFGALAREGYKANGEKPWETKIGPMQHLQDRTRRQISKTIETPEREMKTAIFRRGAEKLVTEMKEVGWRKAINDLLKKVGFDPLLEQKRLYDTLHINELKQELAEVRKAGDITEISAKELEIAKKIQKAVSSFPYKKDSNNPAEMIETQFINCVGSSILGSGLLDEVGIKYLHAHLPEHSATVLVTSDGKAYWQDFTPPSRSSKNYNEISSNMLDEDINFSDLSKFPESGVTISFKKWEINGSKLRVNLFHPEIGLQCHILNNTGNALKNLGRKEEAIEAYKQAISVDPKDAYPYNGLGNALRDLGRHEEAIKAYKQAISVDPKYAYPYNGLGNALKNLGRKEEAIEAYKQAISVDPKVAYPYNGLGNALSDLGRKKGAIKAYKQAISVDPKYARPYNGLGNALSDLGRKKEAIKAYKQAISVDPKDAYPYNGLGNALKDLGRKKEAIKAFEKFIELWTGDQYWINRAKKEIERLKQE
jgi:tetratricopeptide (TPR) repeat protein